jgi:hypothetical protein
MRHQAGGMSSAHMVPPDEDEQEVPVGARGQDTRLLICVLRRQPLPIQRNIFAAFPPHHLHHLRPAANLCSGFTHVSAQQNWHYPWMSLQLVLRAPGLWLTHSTGYLW